DVGGLLPRAGLEAALHVGAGHGLAEAVDQLALVARSLPAGACAAHGSSPPTAKRIGIPRASACRSSTRIPSGSAKTRSITRPPSPRSAARSASRPRPPARP